MTKLDRLLDSLRSWIEKADDDKLTNDVPAFPGLEKVSEYAEDYEKRLAKLLRAQKKHFVDGITGYVKKADEPSLEDIINFALDDLFAADKLAEEIAELTKDILTKSISELTSIMMEAIDKDVMFDILSERTVKWIDSWAEDLGKLMKLNSHEAVQTTLNEGLKEGKGVREIARQLKDLPQFDRKRARLTAQTEVLTASSRSQWEAYNQSPSVTKKKWRHSGSRKNQPRENHVELDGAEVGTDEEFEIPNSGERCQYPRDPVLSGKERILCKCALAPVVDEAILGLSKEEKEQLRQEALKNMK